MLPLTAYRLLPTALRLPVTVYRSRLGKHRSLLITEYRLLPGLVRHRDPPGGELLLQSVLEL